MTDLQSNLDSQNKGRGGGGQLEDTHTMLSSAAGSYLLRRRIELPRLIRTRNLKLVKWLSK